MENKSNDRLGAPAEFTLTPENSKIRVKFLEKNVQTELSSDYTLPDYLPEIRRILGICPSISPISRYFGSTVDFSGRVDHDLVYSTADGEMVSVPLGEDFSFTVDPEAPSYIDFASAGDAFADVRVDSIHVRATAPRKVNVKCRLNALVRAYGYDDAGGEQSKPLSAEALSAKRVCTGLHRCVSEVMELSDEISVQGGTASVRPILSRGSVNVTETTPGESRLNCRGEVITEILSENRETGEISNLTRKIPFTHEIELPEDATGELSYYNVRGKCNEIKLLDSEDKFIIDTEVILEATAAVSQPVSVTEDIFIPGKDTGVSYRDFKYESFIGGGCGKLSISGAIPLSELSISDGGELIDKWATARIDGITQGENGAVISGGVKLKAISKNGGEYFAGEASLPFTYGTDLGAEGKRLSLCADPKILSLNCRADGDKLLCEAELALSYCILGEESIRITDSISVSDITSAPSSGITVYYPEKGETLWSVAKKFGAPIKSLAEANALPSSAPGDPISTKKFILIS